MSCSRLLSPPPRLSLRGCALCSSPVCAALPCYDFLRSLFCTLTYICSDAHSQEHNHGPCLWSLSLGRRCLLSITLRPVDWWLSMAALFGAFPLSFDVNSSRNWMWELWQFPSSHFSVWIRFRVYKKHRQCRDHFCGAIETEQHQP